MTTLTSTEQKPDIKFIHTADTHLGLNWPSIARRDRIQIPVYGRVFTSIIDAALREDVDFLVHGGDLVERPRPSTAAWNRLLEQLPRLKNAGIPFVVIPGTHERPDTYFDQASGDVLEVLDKRAGLVKRIDVEREAFVSFKVKSGKTVTVYGLGDHGSDQQRLLESLQSKMTIESDFRILLMHGSVTNKPLKGATVKADTMSDLLSKGFIDYVALGHNHRRWEHKDLQVYNPGSPEYTDFAEAPTTCYEADGVTLKEISTDNPQPGYYQVEVTGEITNPKFQTVPVRDVRNVQIQFNNATASQVSEAMKNAVAKNASISAIVRPVLKGSLHPSTSRSDIDIKTVMSLRDKFLYLEYPSTQFEGAETAQTTEGTNIEQLLKQYFAARLEKPEDATKIALELLKTYSSKTKSSDQEALNIVDEWKLQ